MANDSIDDQRMVQALGNLVDNALAAVAGRKRAAIGLSLAAADGRWSLAVSDNGRGVPEADLPFVFDRFFRVERDRGRGSGGEGSDGEQ